MPITESTITRQFEIVCINGAPAHVFRETENQILKDGAVAASTIHRESYPADSDEARAVLGDALSAAMAHVQPLVAQIQDLTSQVQALTTQASQDAATITGLHAQVNDLASRLQALQLAQASATPGA